MTTILGCTADVVSPPAHTHSDTGSPPLKSAVPLEVPAIQYQVQAFDVPTTMGNFTSAFGINTAGTIVGNFAAPDESAHGFIFRAGGFTDVVVSGAGPADRGSLSDVNDRGTAVGAYSDADDVFHMYLRDAAGKITLLPDPPGGASPDPSGINNQELITGTIFAADGSQHGFFFDHGVYSLYDHPGALRTRLFQNNDQGQCVGFSFTAGVRHGFILENGTTRQIDVPGATGTGALGINNAGQVVGFFTDTSGVVHGFFLDRGTFTTIDFPGSTDTRLVGINNRGVIVGTYDFFSRGLVATPSQGPESTVQAN